MFRTIALRPPRFLYLSQFGSVWAAKPRLEGGVGGRCCDEATRSSIWVNVRTALGLILFCSALLAGQRMIEGAQSTVPVWTTVRDLPQDHILGSEDIELVQANLPASVLTRYVPAERVLEGAILTRAVGAGELIAADWISSTGSAASRSMTIPVAPEHAVGGDLRPGDRIDVYATFDPGDIRAKTSLLLRGAEVLEVVTAGGLTLGEDALVGITVAILTGGFRKSCLRCSHGRDRHRPRRWGGRHERARRP